MSKKRNTLSNLPLSGKVDFIHKLASNFVEYSKFDDYLCPKYQEITVSYKKANNDENNIRYYVLKKIACTNEEQKLKSSFGFKKNAFDTRRIDQGTEIIPRRNLQFWHRSDEFIDDEKQNKLNAFAYLYSVAKKIKEEFGTRPDWHDSYARILTDALERTLRVKQGDEDIDPEQLKYLEQLIDTRYGLRLHDLEKVSDLVLYNKILKKDEHLLKKGVIYKDKEESNNELEQKMMNILSKMNNNTDNGSRNNGVNIYTTGNNSNAGGINEVLSSLFSGGARKDGEKKVTRTITISITDSAED